MRLFARTFIALLALAPIACTAAGDDPYQEGTQYKRVREAGTPADPKRVEVNEFFWYGCPHCYAFEPTLEQWAKTKPAYVDFVPVPNSLGHPVGLLHSKTYYAAESLGMLPKTHRAFFDALNQDHRPMDNDQQVAYFFNAITGVLPDVFVNTLNGFAVDSRVRRAEDLAKKYGVASTPTVVVDGTYMLNATQSGGFDGMIKVMDFLVEKVRKERKIGEAAAAPAKSAKKK